MWVSAVIGIVSALTSAGAQMSAAKDAKEIGQEQKKAVEDQADWVAREGELKQRRLREAKRRALGTQLAKIGASGFAKTGSPLAAMAETRKQFEEESRIIEQATEQSYGSLMDQARLISKASGSAYKHSMVGAGLTVLGGISSAFSSVSSAYGAASKSSQVTLPSTQWDYASTVNDYGYNYGMNTSKPFSFGVNYRPMNVGSRF